MEKKSKHGKGSNHQGTIDKSAVERVHEKADITTVTMPSNLNTEQSKELSMKAGKILTKEDMIHTGTMIVHLYSHVTNPRVVEFQSFALFDNKQNVREIHAGLAMDELKRKTMANFGRKPKRIN
jgi:hypothetical protein